MNLNKSIFYLLIFLFLFILVPLGFAQEPLPKTIQDYYLLIPEKYFYLTNDLSSSKSFDKTSRLKAISINDAKNGYLELQGHWEGMAEVALFNGTNSIFLGIIVDICAPGCKQNITFLEYSPNSKDKFIEVTSTVLPKISKQSLFTQYKAKKSPNDENYTEDDLPILYRLPRFGTTLQIIVDPQFTNKPILLTQLVWQNGKFNLKK
jgi:hypothetical protein